MTPRRLASYLLAATLPVTCIAKNHQTVTVSPTIKAQQEQQLLMHEGHGQLPFDDIQQFVTAIAAIKHYYIRDVADKTLFDNAIAGMVSELDPHSIYLNAKELKTLTNNVDGQYTGIGIEITTEKGLLKVVSPIDGSPAYQAGLKPGDLIIKVDGKLVSDSSALEAIDRIKGKAGTTVALTVLQHGKEKPKVIDIKRAKIKYSSVKSSVIDGHYGYIRISFFQGPVEKDLHKALKKINKQCQGKLYGLILDLRNNPGGVLEASAEVANTFLNAKTLTNKYDKKIVYTEGRIKRSNFVFKANNGDSIHGIPMVVLINKGSASASEIVAGALQDYHRAIIMGTRSFGKGSVQSIIPISANTAIKLTTALYHTPNGRVIQAKGITPNVVVPALNVADDDLQDFIGIDESDYDNAIAATTMPNKQQQEKSKATQKSDLKLAKSDYQKYAALLMLRGMHAVRHLQ